MTQWCRFLPQYNWQPTVLCQYYGFAATPELIQQEVHRDVRVEYFNPPATSNTSDAPSGQLALGPEWQTKLAKSPIGEWPVPDFSIGIWRKGRAKALDLVRSIKPHAILTTSPPHSIHALGMWLSKETGIPWVADFRDPYVIDLRFRPRGLSKLRWPAHRKFERRIYNEAALVVHAIPIQARWARMAYRSARARIVTLTNGCPLELAEGKVKPALTRNGRRSIRVVGSISPIETEQLARTILRLVESGIDAEFVLVSKRRAWIDSIGQLLGDRLVATGALRHDLALQQVAGADVLVCTLSYNRSGALLLSSKLFEYLATGKPVIVINPTVPDRQFLRNFSGVRMLVAPDDEELETALRWALEPDSKPPLEQTRRFREEFNRRTQTAQLAGWLNELTRRSESPAGTYS